MSANDAREGQVGTAYGLCRAYCAAVHCADDPTASATACQKVKAQHLKSRGSTRCCANSVLSGSPDALHRLEAPAFFPAFAITGLANERPGHRLDAQDEGYWWTPAG